MIYESDMEGRAGQPPDLQFRYIEQLASKRRVTDRDDNGMLLWDDFDYMSHVQPAAEAFGIAELSKWKLPDRSLQDALDECRNFRAEATRVSAVIMYRYATLPERDPNTVGLDAEAKVKLRFHLKQIHTLIDNEQLPDWVKEELHSAVSELEREFDKARTHLGAVFQLLGKVWDGSTSVGDALRKAISIVHEAKKAEVAAIKSPPQQKLLPAQKLAVTEQKSPEKTGNRKRFDDEIPF